MPRHQAAMPTRPPSSRRSACLKPWFSSPIRFSAGTRTFSRMTSAVSLERSPSFSILRPLASPGVPFSTTKAETPRCPCSGAVEAITTYTCPTVPCVMNIFEPLSTHESPSRTARVRSAAASLPEPGVVARDPLHDEQVGERVGAAAAHVLGERDPEEAERGEALHGLVREAFLAVPGGGVRLHLALAEVADRRLDVTVLVGEREIHLVRSLRKRRSPRDVRPDPVDDLLRGGAGREDPGDAGPGERRHVLVGDDAAAEDQLVAAAPLAQLLDHGGKESQVRAGEDREPDRVHVLLDGRLGHHLGRLVEARVDHLEARVAQRPGDDLGAAVMPVEAGLRHQDAERAVYSHAGSRYCPKTSR